MYIGIKLRSILAEQNAYLYGTDNIHFDSVIPFDSDQFTSMDMDTISIESESLPVVAIADASELEILQRFRNMLTNMEMANERPKILSDMLNRMAYLNLTLKATNPEKYKWTIFKVNGDKSNAKINNWNAHFDQDFSYEKPSCPILGDVSKILETIFLFIYKIFFKKCV